MRGAGCAFFAVLLALAGAAARGDEPSSPSATATAAPAEVRDYPDITYWTAWEDKVRADFAAARQKIAEQLERAKSLGGSGSEVDRLHAVDDELEKSAAQLESICRFEIEHDEFEDQRARLDAAEKSLAERVQAFAAERAAAATYTAPDLQRAQDDLVTVSKTRDALRQKVRDLPKQLAETRRAREKALDDYLQIEPTAVDRLTLEGARRERLKLELAYLDSYLEFLPERLSMSTRRLEILTRDEKLHEDRVQFIRGVLSGRLARRRDLAARRAEVADALARKTKERAAAHGGTAEAARLAAEERLFAAQLWLVDLERQGVDDEERLHEALPLLRAKIEKYQTEAASSDESDPAQLAADAERTRGYVVKFQKDVDAQAARLEHLGADFGGRIAQMRTDEAAASAGGNAALAADLGATIGEFEKARDDAIALQTELLKSLEDVASETTKILKIRERARAKAEEQASLFDRRPQRITVGAFHDALLMARDDAAAVRAELAGDGRPPRPRWVLGALAAAGLAAALLHLRLRRRIDDALRRHA
jgi:hypothetical protein